MQLTTKFQNRPRYQHLLYLMNTCGKKTWCGCRGKVFAVRYLLLQQDARPLHICGRTDYSIEWLRVIVSWLCDNIKFIILWITMDNKIDESGRNIYVSSKKPSPVEAFMETLVEKKKIFYWTLLPVTSGSLQATAQRFSNIFQASLGVIYIILVKRETPFF